MPHGAFYSQVVIPSEARNPSLNHRTHKKRAGDKSRLAHTARVKYSKEKQRKSGHSRKKSPLSSKTTRPTMKERIIIDPEIQHGNPVIRGTRVPVTRILGGGLEGKMTFDEICQEYEVTAEDIQAAINYAEDLVEQETHHPLPIG